MNRFVTSKRAAVVVCVAIKLVSAAHPRQPSVRTHKMAQGMQANILSELHSKLEQTQKGSGTRNVNPSAPGGATKEKCSSTMGKMGAWKIHRKSFQVESSKSFFLERREFMRWNFSLWVDKPGNVYEKFSILDVPLGWG
jgi:hypothetical protein